MKANILTLYPEMFPGCLGYSLIGKALAEKKWDMVVTNIRDYSDNAYKSVDDTPFGGGAGMVMCAEVLDKALTAVHHNGPIFYLSPRGKVFNQAMAAEWAKMDEITFICGRFEGVDQRVLDKWNVQEISIGDYVLSGGEPALITMLDATVRLIDGVLGNAESIMEESFSNGLLEYPQYTKPQNWQGREVPEVLLSGHHEKIRAWRLNESEQLTKTRRPDLYEKYLATKKGN
ncbi:MAG: tRNA (guanosine(37)-N1)-methyltransferase TrmD [Alphaproteobacteria bacterium]|nr:tRNA (guanosine(37)-N1)-methyltransferase TrmD [Alphaproteobacteria bacterium]